MRSPDPPSPVFPPSDPILADDVNGIFTNNNMEFLNEDFQSPKLGDSIDFDELFPDHSTLQKRATHQNETLGEPSEPLLDHQLSRAEPLKRPHQFSVYTPSDSTESNLSPASSADSTTEHTRKSSVASGPYGDDATRFQREQSVNPGASPGGDALFGLGPNSFMDLDMDHDFKNSVLNSEFEVALRSPNPPTNEALSPPSSEQPCKLSPSSTASASRSKLKRPASSGSPFYNNSSREASPMATLSPQAFAGGQWDARSPSSVLGDFGAISMNGPSPFGQTASPRPSPSPSGWSTNQTASFPDFGTSSFNTANPENRIRPLLTVHPTSLKSRVETQIPIRLTLTPLPPGVKKLRLPSYTISKPKFLASSDVTRSPEILELHTSLVCTSAMQDEAKLKRAFARARGENVARSSSNASGTEGSADLDEKPLEGGEVKICPGCIRRERKRASRKKQRKPEEDELFQKDEDKRVIVFNTYEIQDWVEPPGGAPETTPFNPTGAMQVELPMRIACYCRHQNEKIGFQVIFTVKDYKDNVVAQAITNSIMITDDHKAHAASASATPTARTSTLPDGTQLPGAGVFEAKSKSDGSSPGAAGQPGSARSSQSTTDLHQSPSTPGSGSIPQSIGASRVSRSSSSDQQGPSVKRRKHSNSGKLPPSLMMTQLEVPSRSPIERPFATPFSMPGTFSNGPPTPNNDNNHPFFNSNNNLSNPQLMSAPSSAHPSRPGSPNNAGQNNPFGDSTPSIPPAPSQTTQAWPMTNAGNRLPTIIHKLVPSEGSITGGTEVTILGSGFHPGMEIVFGDTLATTTTYWGDKCLNCLTPPALQPGVVPVVFKHEHPSFGPVQQPRTFMPRQQHYFRYVDDRELQMYRMALSILGQKLRNPSDAFQTAQRIMGDSSLWNLQNDLQGGTSGQRQAPNLPNQAQTSDLDSKMLTYLEFLDLDDSPRAPRYNSRSATGQTLLHYAASLGLTRFVAGLLARGASPDVQDRNGHTPMHLAALSGHAHIVHRLRIAGGDAMARSVRGFTPADLATTLAAHQAALIPARHYRSESVGSSPSLRRAPGSTASLSSFWEASSVSDSFHYGGVDSDDEPSDSGEEDENVYFSSRRSSLHDSARPTFYTREENSGVQVDAHDQAPDASASSPPAALVAWRNQLAAQIHQFQQSVGRAFPNLPALPALPPMPALPDYQAYPMMRRISNLVPHRPVSSWSGKDGWWNFVTGNSSPTNSQPPSYDELYPRSEETEDREHDRDREVKKRSIVTAAAEAALDKHFEEKERASSSSSSLSSSSKEITGIRIGGKTISRAQQEELRQQQARKMKGLRKDKNLFFFWIPMLLLFLGLWLRNLVPNVWHGMVRSYEVIRSRPERPEVQGVAM